MQFNETPNQGQPHSQTTLRTVERALRLGKQIKDVRQDRGGDSDSGISNAQFNLRTRFGCAEKNLSAFFRVFLRVVQKVGNNLRKPGRIA